MKITISKLKTKSIGSQIGYLVHKCKDFESEVYKDDSEDQGATEIVVVKDNTCGCRR